MKQHAGNSSPSRFYICWAAFLFLFFIFFKVGDELIQRRSAPHSYLFRHTSADAEFGPPETATAQYSSEHALFMVDGNKERHGKCEHVVEYLSAR
jgi:hypothetical protein